jgi:RNA polymerase sigma factor (sigma-70 family)
MIACEDYTSLSDNDLLSLVANDNEKAFETIYERYWLLLLHTANQRLHDKESSMDVIQNVFIDLWTRRKKTVIENLKAYLMQAVRFQVYRFIEKYKGKSAFIEPADIIAASSSTADYSILDKELMELFHDWIETLPPRQKEIFLLCYENNLSTSEISKKLNISRKTVQNQLGNSHKAALEHLQKSLIFLLFFQFPNIF